jgi:hypothetical protein
MKYVCPDCGESNVECLASVDVNWDINKQEPSEVTPEMVCPDIPGWADAWCNNCECNWEGRFAHLEEVPDGD